MTTILKNIYGVSRLTTPGIVAASCLALFFSAGCSNQSGMLPQQTPVTVNISAPSSTTLPAGSSMSLTASASTGGISWTVYAFPGNPCTGSSCGTLSSTTGTTVQFTAPANTAGNSSETVEVRATSTTTPSIFSTIDFTVTPVAVTITSPNSSTVSVTAGSTLKFVASATTVNTSGAIINDPSGVTWSLTGSGCTGSGCGTLSGATSTSVTYNAPAAASTTALSVTVTAASVTDIGETASVAITIPPAVVITITPAGSTTLSDGASVGLSASTTNDPNNSGVTWSLTCTIGGTSATGSTCGVLSGITPTSVVYTAPSVPAGAVVASVIATSVYTPGISTTQLINAPAGPVITITAPSSTVVDDNTSLTLAATVANDVNNAGITWTLACTINATPGVGAACGTISGATNSATGSPTNSSITYNAPPATPNAIAIVLTATSNANGLVTKTQALSVPSAPVIAINSPASNASVSGGASQVVSATITNDSNGKGVTWTLSCNTGNGSVTTGSACGTVTGATNTATTTTTTASSFTYKAPAAQANPINVTVKATSNLLSTSINTLALIVPGTNPVVVSVAPGSATVADGATQSLTATVTNDTANAGVTWSLSCVSNGVTATDATCGTLSVTANPATPYATVYTAPAYPQYALTVMVTAASNTANTVTSSSVLSVAAAPALTITVTPQPVAPNTVYYAQSGVGLTLNAVVNNDQGTPGVTWTVAAAPGSVCPPAGCGTFSAPSTTTSTSTDTYTPPSGLATPLSVVLTATSNSETNVTSTLNVTANVAITFSPNVLGYAVAGQSANFTQVVSVTGGTPPYTSITANNLPSWVSTSLDLTAGTITLSGTPPTTPSTSPKFKSIAGGSYATPTILGTGTLLVTFSAVDSTPGQPLTATASAPITTYSPDQGTGTVGPNNAMMTGSYAFYGTGFVNQAGSTVLIASTAGYPLSLGIIGSFTTDGGGNLTGEVDINGPTGATSYNVTGSYNVEPNQMATITLLLPTTPVTPITFVSALGGLNSSNIATTGQFIEYDDATGNSGNRISGEMALVTPSVLGQSSSPLSGSFAFGTQGATPGSAYNSTCESAGTCGSAASAGQITFTSGAITGTEDVAYGASSASQVSMSGSLNNSGSTDAFGRATGTITAANSSLTNWPTNYVLYPVSPSLFYFMSIDPFTTTSMMSGKAMQQNLADIQSTPMSGPFVLFGNAFAHQAILAPAAENGGMAALFALTATPSSTTAGTLAATTNPAGVLNGYTNNGTATAQTKFTNITGIGYSVIPSSGRVALSGGTFTGGTNYLGAPILYLVDTNLGFAVTTPALSNTSPTGMLVFYPQTGVANGLNAGNYTAALYKVNTPTSVTETGIFNMPSAIGTTALDYTGQMFISYNAKNEESNAAGGSLFDLNIAGSSTLKVTGGVAALNIQPGGEQGCNGGVGFMISPTSFVCLPSGAGMSQQPLYAVQ